MNLKNYLMIMSLFTALFSTAAASGKDNPIIPAPVSYQENDGYFKLNGSTIITTPANYQKAGFVASLKKGIELRCGLKLESSPFKNQAVKGIIFNLKKDLNIHPEGYKMVIGKKTITIEASSEAGLFYAVQSLLQLIPTESKSKSIKIKCSEINDYPRFAWRGLHLDVCRHFMPKEFVLKYLDYMALHKLNRFHFHLTEDQGWRIEIKKYPELTTVGSFRSETLVGHGAKSSIFDGVLHMGFYTQEDIKEIVRYAAERYITVVPEIEMPGHALAALASYPHLGCTGGPYKVATKWGVFDDVMCAGKESTFEFLENVLDEVIDLFPSELIHIGGDECPKTRWKECPLCQERIKSNGLKDEHELQSYFIGRIEKYLNSKGRQIIGWDEILEGGLAPNAAVMSWRGEKGGIEAAKMKHNVVMSPGSHCYFDHYQFDPQTEPLAIGGFTNLAKVYSYEPVPKELALEEQKYIMGAQANVWTEYIPNPEHAEYMVFPRVAALAEVVWSQKDKREYKDFKRRLDILVKLYDKMNINYCPLEFRQK
jgi:hexosaminidase